MVAIQIPFSLGLVYQLDRLALGLGLPSKSMALVLGVPSRPIGLGIGMAICIHLSQQVVDVSDWGTELVAVRDFLAQGARQQIVDGAQRTHMRRTPSPLVMVAAVCLQRFPQP